jgi:TPP-dependent trihydroxycyclohexane-1,2-dione (THcHDO) dehydratase
MSDDTTGFVGSIPENYDRGAWAYHLCRLPANALAAEADAVLAIGTRLSDFTTASRTLFRNSELRLIQLNIAAYDAVKHSALPLVADAQIGLAALGQAVAGWSAPSVWTAKAHRLAAEWNDAPSFRYYLKGWRSVHS